MTDVIDKAGGATAVRAERELREIAAVETLVEILELLLHFTADP